MKTAKRNNRIGFLAALLAGAALLLAAPALASASVQFKVATRTNSTVAPNSTFKYGVGTQNIGDASGLGTETLVASLPAGVEALSFSTPSGFECSGDGPGAPPAVQGASTLTCTLPPSALLEPDFGSGRALVIEAHAGALAEGSTALAHFDLYFDSLFGPVTRLDGGPCDAAPPGTPCASTVDPTRVTSAAPAFGIDAFDMAIAKRSGAADLQAGAHPYSQTTYIDFNSAHNPAVDPSPEGPEEAWPVKATRDVLVDLPPGFVGSTVGIPQCKDVDLIAGGGGPTCPSASQVGVTSFRTDASSVVLFGSLGSGPIPVYNMAPPPGTAARFAFEVAKTVISIDVKLRSGGDYGLIGVVRNISEGLAVSGSDVTLWGDPADESHRIERSCPGKGAVGAGGPTCPGAEAPVAFLRNPTSCLPAGQGLASSAHIDSYANPASFNVDGSANLADSNWHSTSSVTHGPVGFPYLPSAWGPQRGTEGCENVKLRGSLEAKTTARETETPTGLNVHVEVPNFGITSSEGVSSSDIKGVRVALPEGVTINPSQAEGLGVCSPAQYQSSALTFAAENPAGCPSDSKIGTVEVKTPLIEETIPGQVFIASPFDNPFGSLLALYIVLEEPQRGILVKLPGKVETLDGTGQVIADFQNLPQLPFSTLDFKFREGARAPLVTPQACGDYTTRATFTGWSNPDKKLASESDFTIDKGIGGGACPSGGLPPFKPGLVAGSLNNNAGSYSPFNLRLFRSDGEQEFTNFSIKLPPGLSGKLAGVPFCPDAAIAAAKSRSGGAEIASPSCPKASEVGRTLSGAGVGTVLTYVPGKLYLAGPYHGSQLSIAAITAAKVGPFDLGTVVIREALRVNPETAEVFVDPTGSDPIPHIIDGVTVHLRDIRAYVDKPGFALNPTSCDPTSTASTVLGSGLDFASAADDQPVTVTTRYQAANCANLGFKPKLALSLKGGTKRGQNPAFKAVLTARKGDANIGAAQVTLPHSEFLDQSHIKTICTRVQFKEGAFPGEKCPKGSIYGYAKAITPLLDEPLQGPVFLRSSSHNLPDLVAALHSGRIDINLVGRIDSVKGGRIRNSFEAVPDAPVTKFTLTMQGAKKGLLVNSTNLCRSTNRAISHFTGQNGKVSDTNPVLVAQCKHAKNKRAKHTKKKG